jgi:hypothetical protein
MMFTHEQLSAAIQEAGRDGKPFTSAAVRGILGMTTQDRQKQTRFNNEFRAYQKAHGEELEKLGNNRYRVLTVTAAAAAEPAPVAVEIPLPIAVQPAIERGPVIDTQPAITLQAAIEPEPVPEPVLHEVSKAEPFKLGAAIITLLRPVLDAARGSYQLARRVSDWFLRAAGMVGAHA